MKVTKIIAAALLVALPVLGAVAPAQALTAHQYETQGNGRYVSSKKRVGGMMMMHRHHRRMHMQR